MEALGASQASVALWCGISQPHLSKVLARKVKLAPKTRARLEAWSSASSTANPGPEAQELRRIVERLAEGPPDRVMHIMQILRLLDAVTR